MSDQDIRRIKEDLATVKRAAGLELPFGRQDVRANLAAGAAGLVALVWALLPHELPKQWGLIPLVLLAIGHTLRMRASHRRSTGASPTRRREYTLSLIGAGVLGGAMVIYRIWGTKLDIPMPFLQGAAMFFAGLLLVLPACADRGRTHWLALALPVMACGLAIPLEATSPFVLLGAAFVVGGPAMAAVQTLQLRRIDAQHAD